MRHNTTSKLNTTHNTPCKNIYPPRKLSISREIKAEASRVTLFCPLTEGNTTLDAVRLRGHRLLVDYSSSEGEEGSASSSDRAFTSAEAEGGNLHQELGDRELEERIDGLHFTSGTEPGGSGSP